MFEERLKSKQKEKKEKKKLQKKKPLFISLPPPLTSTPLLFSLPPKMPRWFGSSAAASDDAAATPAPSSSPPSRDELEKLRKRVDEVSPRAFSSLLASQEPGLSPEATTFDDDTLTRWLVAEERDVERAAQRLAAHAEWRSALLPAGWTPDKGEKEKGGSVFFSSTVTAVARTKIFFF